MYYLSLHSLVLGVSDYCLKTFYWCRRTREDQTWACVCMYLSIEFPQKNVYIPTLNYTIKRPVLGQEIETQGVRG